MAPSKIRVITIAASAARVALRPFAELDPMEEIRAQLVEQVGLLEIEDVAGLGEQRQARERHVALHEQRRLEA